MLQISVDVTVLSQSQSETLADFILSFPNPGDDPIRLCPKMEVDPSLWTKEELAEDEGSTMGFEFPDVSEDIWHPTDEQLKGINRSLSLIDGEATTEQIEAAFRSVMTLSS
jgi:hypothetical protein